MNRPEVGGKFQKERKKLYRERDEGEKIATQEKEKRGGSALLCWDWEGADGRG